MNFYSYYLAVAITALIIVPLPMVGLTYNQKMACGLTASLLGGYAGYTWLRTPEQYQPTLATINAVTLSPTENYPLAPKTVLEDLSDFMDRLPWIKNRRKKVQPTPVTLSDSKQCIRLATPTINLDKVPAGQAITLFSPFCSKKTIKRKNKVYVTGAPGRGAYAASRYIANGAIPQNATCVTFDYRDTRAGFNLGQETDQQALKLAVDEVARQAHPIILFGACRGALNILNFITTQPTAEIQKNMRAVIVEAPPFSLHDVCKQHARSYLPLSLAPEASGEFLYALYRAALPAHKNIESTIVQNVANIPADLPILIVHLQKDTYVSDENIQLLLQELVATGHTKVHVLALNDPTLSHATMSTAPAYARAIHAFLQLYGLPHDAQLARQGACIQSSFLTPLDKLTSIDTLWIEQSINANGWLTAT